MRPTTSFIDTPSLLAPLSEWEAFAAQMEKRAAHPDYAEELSYARRVIA